MLIAAIVAMTNLCGVVSVDTHGARVVSYIPEGGDEVISAVESGGTASDAEFEVVDVKREVSGGEHCHPQRHGGVLP